MLPLFHILIYDAIFSPRSETVKARRKVMSIMYALLATNVLINLYMKSVQYKTENEKDAFSCLDERWNYQADFRNLLEQERRLSYHMLEMSQESLQHEIICHVCQPCCYYFLFWVKLPFFGCVLEDEQNNKNDWRDHFGILGGGESFHHSDFGSFPHTSTTIFTVFSITV